MRTGGILAIDKLVGVKWVEHPKSWSQTKRHTVRRHPEILG